MSARYGFVLINVVVLPHTLYAQHIYGTYFYVLFITYRALFAGLYRQGTQGMNSY